MTYISQSFIGTQPKNWEGETLRGNTWAYLRAPAWEGAGVLPSENYGLPYSENWSQLTGANHSAGYPKALTRLLKAFPVSVHYNSPESPTGTFLTAMGFSNKRVSQLPAVDEVYLNLGTGYSYGGQPDGLGEVRNGMQHYALNGNGPVGYDWYTTAVSMVYCQVNITYNDFFGNEYTIDVTIDDQMFPADPDNEQSQWGTYVTTLTYPEDGWTHWPKFKINSVTILDPYRP